MEQHIFGATGKAVATIGQGTWYIEAAPRADAVSALQRGLDLGMTHIDTAEMYGSGKAEEIVGEAIAGRRNEVFLVSKVLPDNASARGTVTACEQSLRRLKTDYLDCYLLHWLGSYPLEETFAGFEKLKTGGKIRSWGVSNFDHDDIAEAVAIVGKGKIVCNQVLYHLEERAIEHGVIPACEEHGIAVVGYSPFGHSRFPGPQSGGGKVLQDIARAHNATPRQVALAFLTRRPSLLTIPKAAKGPHVEDNAGAGALKLTKADEAAIDAAFPLGRRKSLPMI
jgi:diketogulonate reductase-like aldo/keto reductase